MGLALLPFFLLLASTIEAQSLFDVTRYGAKPNTDITQASIYAKLMNFFFLIY